MNRVFLAIVFLLAVSFTAQGSTIPDTTENRIGEANRYLSVMPPKDLLIDLVQKLFVQLPDDKRKTFHDLMLKNMDMEKFTSIIRDAMVKNFTAEELHALANFYGSPVGKSAMAKFGNYMADAMPHLQNLLIQAAQKTQTEMTE